jgi:hypothetical protein
MEEKDLSEQESLLLIRQMINTAKKEQTDDGKGWIIWGWMLFAASVLTMFNLHYHWFVTFFFWNLFGLATILIFIYETVNRFVLKKGVRVRTYTKDLFDKLNTGFFISLMFIIIAMNVGVSPMIGFPLLINLYAFWILIYGSALNFKPSVIASYVTWAVGIGALFVTTFQLVMLFHGLAVLFGYIIPGHIANREFNKLKTKDKVAQRV